MIETERLVLRPYRPILAARIADGAPRDPRWADGFPGDGEQLAARMFLQAGAPAGPWVPYTVELRATGQVVGGAGFHGPPDRAGTVEIGYGLVPGARGHGYATEAALALVEFAAHLGARCGGRAGPRQPAERERAAPGRFHADRAAVLGAAADLSPVRRNVHLAGIRPDNGRGGVQQ
ncbi:GNAT family N-acetyltransferase [Catellatospora bangladeshensis]|uniref:GNAT family N-acetyltransferase n=1 Tax=Catellatospora bangladeshensis TaxID=310355 RepID=UPI003618DBB8